MDYIILTYLIYLLLSATVTVWVAQTLHRNGRIFLVDCFRGNEALADSVNHLLVVGFYLINIGFVSLHLKLGVQVVAAREVFEALSAKLGVVLLVVGAMHFLNIAIFNTLRKRGMEEPLTPPRLPNLPVRPA